MLSVRMFNLYRQTSDAQTIMKLCNATSNLAGRLGTGDIGRDCSAMIVRTEAGSRVLDIARWGMPSSTNAMFHAASRTMEKLRVKKRSLNFEAIRQMEPDRGVTTIRNAMAQNWEKWLGPAHRCLVPFTAFSKPVRETSGKYTDAWLRLAGVEQDKVGFFAGFHIQGWVGVRDSTSGIEVMNLFAILVTDLSQSVQEIPRAIPAILTTSQEYETWLNAPWSEASKLQRAVPQAMIVQV